MVNNEQINILLGLLDKEEVQMKIFHVIADRLRNINKTDTADRNNPSKVIRHDQQEKIESLQNKVSELQSLLEKEKKSAAELEQNLQKAMLSLKTLKAEGEDINKKLENSNNINQDLEKRVNKYRENFENDLRIQNLYQGFSESTKTSLTGIFKDTSIKGLIACGIQEKNISNLWDYIKNESIHGGNIDESNLVIFFKMLFNLFALAYPNYKLELSLTGEEFNNQKHVKHHSSSASSGTIKKIVLPGYTNVRTEKPIKQSLVVI